MEEPDPVKLCRHARLPLLMDDAAYVSLPRFIEHWDGVRYVTVQLLRSFDEEDLEHRLLPEWRSRGWLLLHHAYQDELHHRGQLYAVARLLGRTPPVVYAEEHPEYWNQVKGR